MDSEVIPGLEKSREPGINGVVGESLLERHQI
jgi:hypothetical protein